MTRQEVKDKKKIPQTSIVALQIMILKLFKSTKRLGRTACFDKSSTINKATKKGGVFSWRKRGTNLTCLIRERG